MALKLGKQNEHEMLTFPPSLVAWIMCGMSKTQWRRRTEQMHLASNRRRKLYRWVDGQ